jgi:lysophospholipase L1-like esterase
MFFNIVFSQETKYHLNLDEIYCNLPADSNTIIFIGTSITYNFPIYELFKNFNVKNRGINGDNTYGIYNRLSCLTNLKPKIIIVEVGINDLGNNIKLDSIKNNFIRICSLLKDSFPKTKIYLQSILPTNSDYLIYPSYCNTDINYKINQTNQFIKFIAKNHNFNYLDLYKEFSIEDKLNSKYTFDGGSFK